VLGAGLQRQVYRSGSPRISVRAFPPHSGGQKPRAICCHPWRRVDSVADEVERLRRRVELAELDVGGYGLL
jgi:hypothetical protein